MNEWSDACFQGDEPFSLSTLFALPEEEQEIIIKRAHHKKKNKSPMKGKQQ